jgi:hypothetical protein
VKSFYTLPGSVHSWPYSLVFVIEMLDLDEIIQLQYSIDNLKGLDIIRSSVTRYRAPGLKITDNDRPKMPLIGHFFTSPVILTGHIFMPSNVIADVFN